MAKNAEDRAELELRNLELARIRTEDDIRANKDYGKVQKKQLLEQVAFLAEAERARVEFDKRVQIERDSQQVADAEYRSRSDALQQQYDLTDSTAERKRLALALVDAEEDHLRKTLEAVRDSGTANDADKRAAAIDLERLNILAAGKREQVRRDNLTPGQKYLRDLNVEAENLGDAYENVAVKGLERMSSAFRDATKNALGLHGVMGDLLADFIELAIRQQVLGPLANALFGGGGLGSLFGGGSIGGNTAGLNANFDKVFAGRIAGARASGGPVSAGQSYLVGERGPEIVRMGGSGFVVPNHALNAVASSGAGQSGVAVVRVELTQDLNARIVSVSGPVAVETVRANAPAIINAAASFGAKRGEAAVYRRQRRALL